MFPNRQQRPMAPFRPVPPQRRSRTNQSTIMSMFQDSNGNIDLERISLTAKQINDIYSQVSPLISQFRRR